MLDECLLLVCSEMEENLFPLKMLLNSVSTPPVLVLILPHGLFEFSLRSTFLTVNVGRNPNKTLQPVPMDPIIVENFRLVGVHAVIFSITRLRRLDHLAR
jgi:hypothetical protein